MIIVNITVVEFLNNIIEIKVIKIFLKNPIIKKFLEISFPLFLFPVTKEQLSISSISLKFI